MREVKPQTKTLLERFERLLDRSITAVSPAWGFRRARARTAAKVLGAYRGASKDRLRKGWNPLGGSADSDLLPDLAELRERTRYLNQNDAHATAITSTITGNVIGDGIRPQTALDRSVLDIDDERARLFERRTERAWRRWVPWADAQNRVDFYEMQTLVLRQIIENGDVIVLPLMIQDEPWRPLRLALEVIEADRLATPMGKGADANLREGVELGSRGQPVAYHIRVRHPGDAGLPGGIAAAGTGDFRRYPAFDRHGRRNIFHLYWTKRPGQSRGEPFFAPVLNLFKDLGDYLEAEIVAARVAACFAAFITKTDPYGAGVKVASSTNAAGQRVQEFEPGMIEYLGPGEEVTFGQPTRPGGTFESFVMLTLRSIGSALGLPLELVMKDFSKSNYSSARAALLEAWRLFRNYQRWMALRFCQPVWEMVQEEAWLREEIPSENIFGPERDDWLKARWISPGRGWIDPVKEVKASDMAVKAGVSTLAEEAAAQGRDWEEIASQRERERAAYREKGLPLDDEIRTPGQGAPVPGADEIADEVVDRTREELPQA